VVVSPTVDPFILWMWASMRAVVVLPLVPVTAAMGMRAGVPGAKSMSTTSLPTSRGVPSVGATCMRKPGRRDLADPAADLAVAPGDVGRDEVDADDVEPDALAARRATSRLSGASSR